MAGLITETPTDPAPGDSTNTLLGKVIRVLKLGGGGGGGGGGAVTIADGADQTLGAKADARATDSTSPWSVIALLKEAVNFLNTIVFDLANPLTVTGSVGVSSLPAVTGNVGGFTTVAPQHVTVSTSAYVAGEVLGGLQTLTTALRTNNGSGVLESLVIMDRSAQKAAMDVYILSATPAGTYTDHSALVWGAGDDLTVLGMVSVATTDYGTTDTGKSFAVKSGLGIALKGTDGTQKLFAFAVTSGTPTYTNTTDVQFVWGILQD